MEDGRGLTESLMDAKVDTPIANVRNRKSRFNSLRYVKWSFSYALLFLGLCGHRFDTCCLGRH